MAGTVVTLHRPARDRNGFKGASPKIRSVRPDVNKKIDLFVYLFILSKKKKKKRIKLGKRWFCLPSEMFRLVKKQVGTRQLDPISLPCTDSRTTAIFQNSFFPDASLNATTADGRRWQRRIQSADRVIWPEISNKIMSFVRVVKNNYGMPESILPLSGMVIVVVVRRRIQLAV